MPAELAAEILQTIMETTYDGISVVDSEGFITMMSENYKRFLNCGNDVIGKHVTGVIENTRMHIVAKSGIPEVADLQMIKGNYMVVSRFPLLKDGELVGAVGKVLFRNISDLERFYRNIIDSKENRESNGPSHARYDFDSIIGECKSIVAAKEIARQMANNHLTILLGGESGTGKELFAHAIHHESARSKRPFVCFNCAAIPSELFESELFGYTEGSFTGAQKGGKKGGKKGKIEHADGGTIFLDEIGELPLDMQAKLLRFLQEWEIEKIGAKEPVKVDVRVIAASNKDLLGLVEKGTFRKDLFYRLNVVTIRIPALRERVEDIPRISYYMLERFKYELKKHYVLSIHPKTMEYFQSYQWPGNLRELENHIKRALSLTVDGQTALTLPGLSKIEEKVSAPTNELPSLKDNVDQLEKNMITEYLALYNGNKAKVARALKICRVTLYEKMERLGIEV